MIRKKWKAKLLYSVCLCIYASHSFASGFQVFNGINYTNPAELPILVNNFQLQLGDDYVMPYYRFKGVTTVPPPTLPIPLPQKAVVTSGTSISNSTFNLPYGRLAKRIHEGLVIGLDVTEPFVTRVVYPHSSPVRYAGTEFNISSTDISPNIAYQFGGSLSKLSIGAGFDALHIFAVANQNIPSLPVIARRPFPHIVEPFGAGRDIEFNNDGSGWAYGWHAGLAYRVFPATLISLSYFSKITPKIEGSSTFSGYPNTQDHSEIPLPASTHLKLTQAINPKWIASLTSHFTQWSRLKTLTITNAAGPVSPVTSTFNWRDTWRFALQSFYTPNKKFILGGGVSSDVSPAYGVFRGPLTPAGDSLTVSLSLEYKITEAIGLIGSFAHVFTYDTDIDKVSYNGTTSVGDAAVNANVVGLRLKVDL